MTKHVVLCFLAALPLLAQKDIAGEWDNRFDEDFLERIPGPDIGDYLGIPINAAARLHADSWDASLLTLPNINASHTLPTTGYAARRKCGFGRKLTLSPSS